MALKRRLHDSNSSSKVVRHVCFSSSAPLTGDEKREFLFVEDGDELWGDDVMKTYVDLVSCLDIDGDEDTFNEMLQLLLHRASKAVLDHQLHILLFCFISHGNIAAILYQIHGLPDTKFIGLNGEGLVGDVRDIILQHP